MPRLPPVTSARLPASRAGPVMMPPHSGRIIEAISMADRCAGSHRGPYVPPLPLAVARNRVAATTTARGGGEMGPGLGQLSLGSGRECHASSEANARAVLADRRGISYTT